MKTKILCRKDLFKHFIGHCCYEDCPDNWESMIDEEVFEWLQSHAWEPFVNHDGETIFGMIDSLTDSMVNFLIDHEINVVV